MKLLYLMRHAKSDWKQDLSDIDRPLNQRGLRSAPRMGTELARLAPPAEMLVASPARRAQHTAQLVAQAWGYQGALETWPEIYFGGMYDALDRTRALPKACASVMLVGHNPTWENLLYHLAPNAQIEKFATAAVAAFAFDTDTWQELGPQTARLEWFIYPKQFS